MESYKQFFLDIVDQIDDEKISIIESPTGSGKSLYFPKILSEKHENAKIFISVPTVVAAINLYNTQKRYGKGKVKVGYAAEGERKYGNNDRIVYVTGGHMRKKMICYFMLGYQQHKN